MPQILTNSSAAGASTPVVWGGGNGEFEASGTFNGTTLTLQSKNGDGSFSDVAGTALTASGKATFTLTPGTVRVNVTGGTPTSVSAAAWRRRGSTQGGGTGGTSTIAGATDYSTATLPAEQTQIALKLPKAISLNASTGVATKPDATTFTPATSTAPPAGCEVLLCTTAGTLPTAIDGVTALALNDGLEWSDVLGVWVWNKAKLAIADLSDHAAVAQLNSSQQTEVAAGATVALLNSVKTALKDPAGGADIALSGVTHVFNYTTSSTQTGVSSESAALMSLSLPALPQGTTLEIRAGITGDSDPGTTTTRLKFGSTTIGTFINGGGQVLNTITASVVCTGSASQWLTGEIRAGSTSPDVESNNTTVDTSAAVTLNATLQNSTTTRHSQIAFIDVLVRLP